MRSEWQINRLPLLFCQNDLTAYQPYQPIRTPVIHLHQQAVARAEYSRLTLDNHWWAYWELMKTSLFLTLSLRDGSLALTWQQANFLKLIKSDSWSTEMGLLLEVKSSPVLIIKPSLSLFCTQMTLVGTSVWGTCAHSKPQQDCQHTKYYVSRSCIAP